MSRSGVPSQILLLNWVSLERKQLYQLDAFRSLGLDVVVLTNDLLKNSRLVADQIASGITLHISPADPLTRLRLTERLLRNSPKDSVVVVPPNGRASGLTIALSRIMRRRTICVEWGDLGLFQVFPLVSRINMRLAYKLSNLVWYKEPFMEFELRSRGISKVHFLPNAVTIPDDVLDISGRTIDFLWANRPIPLQRRPIWFVRALSDLASTHGVNGVLLGLLDNSQSDEEAAEENRVLWQHASKSCEVLHFMDPMEYFAKSKFFVLASEHVFGNNAVLEAMAHGVVPIVTKSPDVEKLVIDGWNGLVTDFDEEALALGMKRAAEMDTETWYTLSGNARSFVRERFSAGAWRDNFAELLSTLD